MEVVKSEYMEFLVRICKLLVEEFSEEEAYKIAEVRSSCLCSPHHSQGSALTTVSPSLPPSYLLLPTSSYYFTLPMNRVIGKRTAAVATL